MDPNAAAESLNAARQELQNARIQTRATGGVPASVIRDLEVTVREHREALREWRRKGGFPPRGGWPKGV